MGYNIQMLMKTCYGQFFGKFATAGRQELLHGGVTGMASELHDTYSKLAYPPQLFQTKNQTLLGCYGVVLTTNDGKLKKNLNVRFLVLINCCHFTLIRTIVDNQGNGNCSRDCLR
jgi:hypothetical protein